MQYVHRWDLGDRGKLFMVTEETMPKGTISLSKGWEGKVKGNPTKVIKILTNAPVTQEMEEVTEDVTKSEKVLPGKCATVANVLRGFAQGLEEKK